MRFTSLVIELIRARPRLVVWIVVLFQAALWLIVPLLFYASPPGNVATVLAFGREYQVGTDLGPPLAFWLADIAFRTAGNHLFGVYVLAQLCSVATFWFLFLLARAIVGSQQAVLAVLLTMTVTAFASTSLEFGPLVLARPLWALLLFHTWQLIGQNRRNVWFAWSIEAGLLLLTTSAAIGLLLLVAGFMVATERGRRTLKSFDPLFALLVIVVLALPYLIWLIRAGALGDAAMAAGRRTQRAGACTGRGWSAGLLLAMVGIAVLLVLNARPVQPHAGGGADHLSPAGRAAGARFRLFLRDRAGACRKPDLRCVRSRPRRRRRRHRAVDVGAWPRSWRPAISCICGASGCCARCGPSPSSRLRCRWSRPRCSCPGPAAARSRPRCRRARSRSSSATVSSGAPISGCARSPAMRSSRAWSRSIAAGRICFSMRRPSARPG